MRRRYRPALVAVLIARKEMVMGNNGTPKARGGAHYLFRQWANTTLGKEEHRKKMLADKKKQITALTRPGGKRAS